MKPVLLMVDIQNDFCEGGSFPIKDANAVIPWINEIRSKYDNKFIGIFNVQDFHPETHISFINSIYAKEENLPFDEVTLATKGKFPMHCVQGTNGANNHQELFLKGTEVLLRKGQDKFKEELSAFANPILSTVLKANNINTVFITGVPLDFDVGWTAMDSVKWGYDTYVIKELSRGLGEASTTEMIKNLEMNKIKVITNAEFEEWLKKCEDCKKEEDKQMGEGAQQ